MNRLNVDRLAAVLSDILSERTGAEIVVRYIPKDEKKEARSA